MSTKRFFASHPVFTVAEFDQFLENVGIKTEHNRKRLLSYHRQQGHLILVRPGLYGVVPSGAEAGTYPLDSYLVAARLTPDSIIGYHSALAYHGVAHSLLDERLVITKHPFVKPFLFRGITYRTVRPPQAIVEKRQESFGVEQQERQGEAVRVTGLERTLVDCLDRQRLGGGWEEIQRSYETVPYLDLESVIHYALLLRNATTIATVGYFLQVQEDRWMVTAKDLDRLRTHRPNQPHYLGRRREERGRLVKEWNLVIPNRIFDRNWEEASEHKCRPSA